MQRVTITSTCYHTRYRTFSPSLTWIDDHATRYYNSNMLPHALPNIFSQFTMVWSYLQCVTVKCVTRYRQVHEKIYIKLKKNDGNLW